MHRSTTAPAGGAWPELRPRSLTRRRGGCRRAPASTRRQRPRPTDRLQRSRRQSLLDVLLALGRALLPAFLGIAALSVGGRAALAQAAAEERDGIWWLDLQTGAASVEADDGPRGDAEGGWLLSFSGGLVAGDHWLLGVGVGGVGFEAGDLWDPSEGRSLSDAFLVAEYHPSLEEGWYLHADAGWASYSDNEVGGSPWEGDGWQMRLGPGYEWKLGLHNHLFLLATYAYGSIAADAGGDWNYSAFALSLGWSLR